MDKFSDTWKNRFNSEDVPKDAWNEPDAGIWKNILAEIPKEEPDRKGVFYILTSILMLFVGFLGYKSCTIKYKNTNAKLLNTSYTQIKNTKNKTLKVENVISVQPSEKEKSTILKTRTPLSQDTILKNISTQLIQERYNSFPKKINSEIDKEQDISTQANFILIDNNIKGLRKKEDTKDIVEESTIVTASHIVSIPIKGINFKKYSHDLKLTKIRKKQTNLLSFSASAGLVYWRHQINNEYLSALDPFEFNYQDNVGFNTQLNLSYQLNNNIRFSTGLSYDRVSINSGHNSMLQYQLQSELTNNENKYLLALATPYGFVDTEFGVQRVGEITNELTMLDASFQSTQFIQNITVPLSIGLTLLSIKKMNVELFTGIGTNYLFKIDHQLNNVNTNHSAFLHNKKNTEAGTVQVNHWHFDCRLGLLLNYNINNKTTFNLQYNYTKGLNAIYKTVDFDTKINRHYLSLSITKAL